MLCVWVGFVNTICDFIPCFLFTFVQYLGYRYRELTHCHLIWIVDQIVRHSINKQLPNHWQIAYSNYSLSSASQIIAHSLTQHTLRLYHTLFGTLIVTNNHNNFTHNYSSSTRRSSFSSIAHSFLVWRNYTGSQKSRNRSVNLCRAFRTRPFLPRSHCSTGFYYVLCFGLVKRHVRISVTGW